MKKEDIMKILPKEGEILKKIDEAYDKVLNRDTRHEGLEELEELRGQDSAIPCIIGHAHEMEFYEGDRRRQLQNMNVPSLREDMNSFVKIYSV